jgi:hypothetical protein
MCKDIRNVCEEIALPLHVSTTTNARNGAAPIVRGEMVLTRQQIETTW